MGYVMISHAAAKINKIRLAARRAGSPYYFTGKPCKHGHVSKRRVSNCGCAECIRINKKNWPSAKNCNKSPKGRERNRRYDATPKGQNRWRTYNRSPKGQERIRTCKEASKRQRREARALRQN